MRNNILCQPGGKCSPRGLILYRSCRATATDVKILPQIRRSYQNKNHKDTPFSQAALARWYGDMNPELNSQEKAKRDLGKWFVEKFDKHMMETITGITEEQYGRK